MKRPMRRAWAPGASYVRLLEHDTGFSDAMPDGSRAKATHATLAAQVEVSEGAWNPDLVPGRRPFAVLVGSGLMVRDLRVADRVTSQLVGPGDVLCLKPSADMTSSARIVAPMQILVLDTAFMQAARRWPELALELVHRCGEWAHRALQMQAISTLSRIDDRLVAFFGYLLGRWGRVTPGGLTIDLRITHAALGRLVGAQRPTVSLALRDLARDERLVRTGDAWLLPQHTWSSEGV